MNMYITSDLFANGCCLAGACLWKGKAITRERELICQGIKVVSAANTSFHARVLSAVLPSHKVRRSGNSP